MADLELHSVRVNYRLPRGGEALKERFDRALQLGLREGIERALAECGFDDADEVCVRRVENAVTLSISDTDSDLVKVWSQSLAKSIHAATRSAAGASDETRSDDLEVIRYANRACALAEAVVNIARGDLRRAWAWRQLSLWRGNISADSEAAFFQLFQMLARQPEAIVPSLRLLIARGQGAAFFDWLTSEQWAELSLRALRNVASNRDLEAWLSETSRREETSQIPLFARQAAARVVRSSPIAESLREIAPSARWSAALLTILEREPILAQRSESVVIVEETRRLLSENAFTRHNELPARRSVIDSESISEIEAAKRSGKSGIENALEAETELAPERQVAETEFGGLLFILNILKELGLPAQIASSIPAYDSRFLLHQLAQALVPIDPEDPAALAFIGLQPGSKPPQAEEPLSDLESVIIRNYARRIQRELEQRLECADPKFPVVDFVCRRPAEIAADLGWFEVRFSLDSVSTEIRRCALDLDPGHISWLGVVVRFRYE